MKPMAIAGLVAIALGVAAFAYQGFTYTSRETVLDIGPVHATADRERTVPISPMLSAVVIAGGVVLLIAGMRKAA